MQYLGFDISPNGTIKKNGKEVFNGRFTRCASEEEAKWLIDLSVAQKLKQENQAKQYQEMVEQEGEDIDNDGERFAAWMELQAEIQIHNDGRY